MPNDKSAEKNDSQASETLRFQVQLSLLKFMAAKYTRNTIKYFELDDLADNVSADEKDVQRSLFVLEGHKLVCPMPPGNFTSRTWCLTEAGMSAIKNLNFNNMALL